MKHSLTKQQLEENGYRFEGLIAKRELSRYFDVYCLSPSGSYTYVGIRTQSQINEIEARLEEQLKMRRIK